MSTQATVSESVAAPVRTREEFAANYPVATQDGNYRNIAIGNINIVPEKITSDGKVKPARRFINLCLKTQASGNGNAFITQPVEWTCKFTKGQYVDVEVKDGYVTKLMPIQYVEPVKASQHNAYLAKQNEQQVINQGIEYGDQDEMEQEALAQASAQQAANLMNSFEHEEERQEPII